MKIHSDILEYSDLMGNLPSMIYADVKLAGSKSRQRAYEVGLCYTGSGGPGSGRRPKNNGTTGAGSDLAATWDEWGIWMAKLFAIDPDAIIGAYRGRDDFYVQTMRYIPRGMHAPWLANQTEATS